MDREVLARIVCFVFFMAMPWSAAWSQSAERENRAARANWVHIGRGDGTFVPGGVVSARSRRSGPRVADWNLDGIPDLVRRGRASGYRNTGLFDVDRDVGSGGVEAVQPRRDRRRPADGGVIRVGGSRRVPTVPKNLGLDGSHFGFEMGGGLLGFRVVESRQGIDLNGDGELKDGVVHVFDTRSGETRNLGLAAPIAEDLELFAGNGRVVFGVPEETQGVDFNGDGDQQDVVLHLYDVRTGVLTNLQQAIFSRQFPRYVNMQFNGDLIAFAVLEPEMALDLNGDGDELDSVVFTYDTSSGVLTNLGLAIPVPLVLKSLRLSDRLLAMRVSESAQGQDLNLDGDLTDTVLFVHDALTGNTQNLGLAIPTFGITVVVDSRGAQTAFQVDEFAQGTDLNGDGDLFDSVLHAYRADTGAITNLALPLSFTGGFQAGQDRIAFRVPEGAHGNTDLNGDGDPFDFVLHAFDDATGTVTNLGLAAGVFDIEGDTLAFAVHELSQGGTDLNGDRDTEDFVLSVHDFAADQTTDFGLATVPGSVRLNRNQVAFVVTEIYQQADLNGDADSQDSVLFLYDVALRTTQNLGLAVWAGNPGLVFKGHRLAFQVPEYSQAHSDLNGDGDDEDLVLHVHDTARGTTRDLGIAVSSFHGFLMEKDRLVFRVEEGNEGGTDLNADGDAFDRVVHAIRLR
jgi:hypothetical protein